MDKLEDAKLKNVINMQANACQIWVWRVATILCTRRISQVRYILSMISAELWSAASQGARTSQKSKK